MSAIENSPYNVEHPCCHDNPPYYLTAYGSAVKQGFRGTERAWIDSLRGGVSRARVVALGKASAETILESGYGTCIVMHDSESCLVFDLGNDFGECLINYLNDNDIKCIDAIYISHFHSDHFQAKALRKIVKKYKVRNIFLPHQGSDVNRGDKKDCGINWEFGAIKNDAAGFGCYKELCRDVEDEFGDICCKPKEGERDTYGSFEVSCHNVADFPQSYYSWNYSELLYHLDENDNEKPPNYNNFSMVNVVTFGGHKIVVTGDIMEPAVERTIDVLGEADLIFVPHHGLDIRIPPSAFNRLCAKHAVINTAYDSYGHLKSVSRAFAGELLKKGCRVVATFDGKTVGYIVGETITPVEPGVSAGNEVYPCSLLPGEDLDTLPDGEYITYSEVIAQSIANAPPFTYRPLRKFKIKVETTCIQSKYEKGNRTQTAYTIDTSTRTEMARRNFTWGENAEKSKYHDWEITPISGQFHSVKRLVSEIDEETGEIIAVDANVDQYLIEQIKDMRAPSYRKIVISLGDALEIGAGGHWATEIFKQSANYAIITAKSPVQGGTSIQRIWFEGKLNDWEWINPPMYDGVVYRTTERIGGSSVYKKLEDGMEYCRIGEGDTWKPVPNEGQFPYTLETDSDAHLDAVLVNYIGNMSSPSYRRVYIKITDKLQSCGIGGHWDVDIFKQSKNYAIVTAKSPIRYGATLQRAWFMDEDKGETAATLHPWEWVNPSMYEGEIYRTTERMGGEPVYRQLSGGAEYYRIGENGEWVRKGAASNDVSLWEQGSIVGQWNEEIATGCSDTAEGHNAHPIYIRTKGYLPDDVELVYAEKDYAFRVAVYGADGAFKGFWDGKHIGNNYDYVYYLNPKGLPTRLAGQGYKIRLLCKHLGAESTGVAEASNIHFLNGVHKQTFCSNPTLTFIDDDGVLEALENWAAISDETGVKITSALVTKAMGDDADPTRSKASWNDVARFQNRGYEFVSHTHGHIKVSNKSVDDCKADFESAIKALREHGCESRYLVYPYNGINADKIELVKQYFVAGVGLGGTTEDPGGTNTLPVYTHWLRRYSINDSSKTEMVENTVSLSSQFESGNITYTAGTDTEPKYADLKQAIRTKKGFYISAPAGSKFRITDCTDIVFTVYYTYDDGATYTATTRRETATPADITMYQAAKVVLKIQSLSDNLTNNALADRISLVLKDGTELKDVQGCWNAQSFRDISTLKSYVDEAIANNDWLIIMTHLRNDANADLPVYHNADSHNMIVELCKYATDNGVTIQTFGEAFQKYKNIMEIGTIYTDTHYVVDCNGVVHYVNKEE